MNRLAATVVTAAEASLVSALPMYDFPELREANDTLWAALRASLAAQRLVAPSRLTRTGDLAALWRDPQLLLAQSCGYPLATSLRGAVQLVATPRYRAPGSDGPFHRSAIIVAASSPVERLAELKGSRLALNSWDSNTGMNLLRDSVSHVAQRRPFFSETHVTGAHLSSLTAIAEGRADVAAIDNVTYAHIRRLYPALAAEVRILQWTVSTPGLPLITSRFSSPSTLRALRRALQAVAADPALAAARRELLLDGIGVLPVRPYREVLALEHGAAARGYPVLI
ncbi:MAG: phosphate/phosphite/phosphonate ABC transporter substrate-binding protein [Phenylobacterium sp.]